MRGSAGFATRANSGGVLGTRTLSGPAGAFHFLTFGGPPDLVSDVRTSVTIAPTRRKQCFDNVANVEQDRVHVAHNQAAASTNDRPFA